MKSDLYDVLVTLPPPYAENASEKVYPKIVVSSGQEVHTKRNMPDEVLLKATQRDVRRFTTLRKGMRRYFHSEDPSPPEVDDDFDTAFTFSSNSIVEPLSWSRRAYTSFIWWASAGEKRLTEDEEEQEEQDTLLLIAGDNISNPSTELPEVALVTYFRRLTSAIFIAVSDAIARSDSGDNDDDDDANNTNSSILNDGQDGLHSNHVMSASSAAHSTDHDESRVPLLYRGDRLSNNADRNYGREGQRSGGESVKITSADMSQMGLDTWSAADRVFVQQLVSVWWGREAVVQGARITCCGIPIL